MCSRFVAAVLLATAEPLGTLGALQGPSPAVRAQARRVDTVGAYWLRARNALRQFDDSVARSRSQLDSIRIGSMRILVAASLRDRVERAARVAASRLDSIAGTAASRLAALPLVVRPLRSSTDSLELLVVMRQGRFVSPRMLGAGEELSRQWGDPPDTTLAAWIVIEGFQALQAGIDSSFRHWLAGGVAPDTARGIAWLRNRLDLVSSGTVIGRRCYDGDLDACEVFLYLRKAGDPVTQWYDAEHRRHYVQSIQRERPWRRNVDWSGTDGCLEGADAACIAVMRSFQNWSIAKPSTNEQRASLAQLALLVGGHGAYERLLTGSGQPPDLLAHVSGVPIDSLVRLWQRRVHDTRLPSQDMSPGMAFSSLAWMLVCGALALRSSRWR